MTQSVFAPVILSQGSIWNPQPWETPNLTPEPGTRWPDGGTVEVLFTDSAGVELARYDGEVEPDAIRFLEQPEGDAGVDQIPAGANYVMTLTGDDGPEVIRHGTVIRLEPRHTQERPASLTPALAFADSFQRRGLGKKWKAVRGETTINNNSELSLPNGVSVKNAFMNRSSIRFWQEFNSDSIDVGVNVVNPLNLQAGKTGFIVCADINLTSGLVMQLETGISHNYIHLGILRKSTSVIWQGSPIANTVHNGDYYRVRYIDGTKRLSVYKGDSLEPLGGWTDEAGVIPHGKGYRHFGMNFEASVFTRGIQVTSCAARDAV